MRCDDALTHLERQSHVSFFEGVSNFHFFLDDTCYQLLRYRGDMGSTAIIDPIPNAIGNPRDKEKAYVGKQFEEFHQCKHFVKNKEFSRYILTFIITV